MTWIKNGKTQEGTAGNYVAVIRRESGKYWATCFRVESNGIRSKQFVFPPRARISELKSLVEENYHFQG